MKRGYVLPQEEYTYSKWPVRILLIAGTLFALASAVLFRTLEQFMMVHFWILLALLAAPLLCFAAAAGLAIRHRMKGSTGRAVVTGVLAVVLVGFAMFVFSMATMLSETINKPVAYYTSPSKASRILVVCTTAYVDEEEYDTYYGAYPLVNNWFYRPSIYMQTDPATGEASEMLGVQSETGVDQVLWYEEEAGERAEVYLTDVEGREVIIDVNFADYSAMLREEA